MGATAQQKEALVETPLVNDTSQPTTSGADSEDSESERSSDLAVALGRLTVDDDPSAVFSDGTGSSSESSHGHSSSIQVLRRERLNQFLRICGKEECVTGQPKKRWGIWTNSGRVFMFIELQLL